MNLSTNYSSIRPVRGFSLIEVLIAVLVLATGMLALAALQGSITRNSVDAKVRSQGLAAAVTVLDTVRARASASNSDYEGLATGAGSWSSWAPPAFGGSPSAAATFQTRTTVTRFVRDSTTAGCGSAANVPCFRPAAAGDAYRLNDTAEFKRITVDVSWTDGTGASRQVSVNDLVTSVTRDKTPSVMNQTPTPPTGGGEPVARIPRPSEAGIIPIAVGDGQETAASNPKPTHGRERGRTDETSFQVYTYETEANNVARLKRVIDNRVLGCRCELGALPTGTNAYFSLPKQPTYWNGIEYIEPKDGSTGLRGRMIANAVQNQDLCVTCCLDHHDFAGQTTKLDSFRNEATHKHYSDPNESDFVPDFIEAAAAGDRYLESCRMIRVNGIFRVATDARLELMNLLETDSTASDSVPLSSKIGRYQAAVKDFVSQKVVSNVASPNMGAYSDVFVDPAAISMSTTGRRYLHNRGLYIDYLEQEARDTIAEAITDCPNGTARIDCVLPYLPFTSINTTDISQWDTDPALTYITITNLGTNTPYPTTGNGNNATIARFARGVVAGFAQGTEEAKVAMQLSNTGLSDSKPIDWDDAGKEIAAPHGAVAGGVAADQQVFRIGNSGGGGGTGCPTEPTDSYTVNLVPPANVTFGGYGVSWGNPAAVSLPGCPNPTLGGTCEAGTNSNSALCNIKYTLPQASLVAVSGFNRAYDGASQSWTCTKYTGSGTPNGTVSGTFTPNMCTNLQVTNVTAGGSPVTWSTASSANDGKPNELVNISIALLPAATPVVVTFGEQTAPRNAGYSCNVGTNANTTFVKNTCDQ